MKQKSYESPKIKSNGMVIRGNIDLTHLSNPMHADAQRRFRSCKWQDKRFKKSRYKEEY